MDTNAVDLEFKSLEINFFEGPHRFVFFAKNKVEIETVYLEDAGLTTVEAVKDFLRSRNVI